MEEPVHVPAHWTTTLCDHTHPDWKSVMDCYRSLRESTGGTQGVISATYHPETWTYRTSKVPPGFSPTY